MSSTTHYLLSASMYHFNPYRIDQLNDKDDATFAFRQIKTEKRISDSNYLRALAKCGSIIKDFMSKSGKTGIGQDFQDLAKNNYRDNKERNILEFTISQKKVLHHQIKLFNNRLIREYQNELFTNIRKNY
jgi:hypothetical protein